ncbi:MAG: TrkH family potassium uptake protein [Clostridia bacterium]|nr:TrkH family potassium uptake protein [Clostridia bacterium]
MNRKSVFYTLGLLLDIEAVLMIVPALVSCAFREWKSAGMLLLSSVIASAAGSLLLFICRHRNKAIYAKEGFVIVSFGWLLLTLFGAMPFVLNGELGFIDAIFETASGFTTTGASIITDLDSLSRGTMFWRSATHWLGGMGVLVLMMAILPTDTEGSVHILRAEVPGPTFGKFVPKLRKTAMILYLIYIGITLIEVVMLLCGGLSIYESLVYAFGTAGTGGFGLRSNSLTDYSAYVQWVIGVFMVLFGVNFNLYYLAIMGKVRMALKSRELWLYFGIVIVSTTLVAVNVYSYYGNMNDTVRNSFFQVSSILSTTGYFTADFDAWSVRAKAVLFMLYFAGGCAGSTAGGIKIARLILLGKTIRRDLRHMVHPHSVGVVKFEGRRVDDNTLRGVTSFFVLYVAVLASVFVLLSLLEPAVDLLTNITASMATLNNVGPGFGMVGPYLGYSFYSPVSKVILSLSMLLGRLEIYPLILLLSPAIWRRK